jgi:adenosyl cobinamide kinase/adenosyl cobinamide phosphate guanylyltransferase
MFQDYGKRIERRKKQRQIIWMDVETFVKLAELYIPYSNDIAMNDFIVNILKIFLNDPDMIEKFKSQFKIKKSYQEVEL